MMYRTKLVFAICMLYCFVFYSCNKQQQTAKYEVIPLPKSVKLNNSVGFVLNSKTKVVYTQGDEELKKNAEFLAEYIQIQTGLSLDITDISSTNNVCKTSS